MKTLPPLLLLLFVFALMSFIEPLYPEAASDSYWVRFCNDTFACGYRNAQGDTMTPADKYLICETDTFRSYAKVLQPHGDWIGINQAEDVLYKIHLSDNGPDYPKEGLFRIWKNGKMGYADEQTGKIILYPQYSCDFPFENGKAKVSLTNCVSKPVDKYGEYHYWETEEWIYIDHYGKKVDPPKPKE